MQALPSLGVITVMGKTESLRDLIIFLANSQWCDLFLLWSICYGQVAYSEHYLIWLDKNRTRINRNGSKPFRLELMWVNQETCTNIIEQVWSLGSRDGSIGDIMQLIMRCGTHLKQWNKTSFGNVQRRLAEVNQNMKKAKEMSLFASTSEEITQA